MNDEKAIRAEANRALSETISKLGGFCAGIKAKAKRPWTTRPANDSASWDRHNEDGHLALGLGAALKGDVPLFVFPGSCSLEDGTFLSVLDADPDDPEIVQDLAARISRALIVAFPRPDNPGRAHLWVRTAVPVGNGNAYIDGTHIGEWRGKPKNRGGGVGSGLRLYPGEAKALDSALKTGLPGVLSAEETCSYEPGEDVRVVKDEPDARLARKDTDRKGVRNTSLYKRVFAAALKDPEEGLETIIERCVEKAKRSGLKEDEIRSTVDSAVKAATEARSKAKTPHKVLNQLQLADAFAALDEAQGWRWVLEVEAWRRWRGDHWVEKGSDELVNQIARLGEQLLHKRVAKGYVPDVRSGGSQTFANGTCVLLRDHLATDVDEWDASHEWIGAPNGKMLHWPTGSVRNMTTDDLVMRRLGCLPDPDADPDGVWPKFLEETIPDRHERAYFKRVVGMALAGRIEKLQICLWLIGPPAAGKSLLLDLLAYLFGGYGAYAPPEMICDSRKGGTSFREDSVLGLIAGARFVRVGDPPEGSRYNLGAYKRMTGDEVMMGRRNNKFFGVERTWLIAIAANHMPPVPSGSIARRGVAIQCPAHHTDDPERFEGYKPVDHKLSSKLRSAAPAILVDLLRSAGKDEPKRPPTTQEIIAVSLTPGSFEAFVAQRLRHVPGAKTPKEFVFNSYQQWQAEAPEARARLSRTEINGAMSSRGFPSDREQPRLPGGRRGSLLFFLNCVPEDASSYGSDQVH